MGIRAGKRGKKWIILTGAGILLAAGIGGICIIQSGRGKKGAAVSEAIGVKAGRDTLSTSVVGSGSLQGGEIQDIQVPSGLVIESVAVETGDTVSAGQIQQRFSLSLRKIPPLRHRLLRRKIQPLRNRKPPRQTRTHPARPLWTVIQRKYRRPRRW